MTHPISSWLEQQYCSSVAAAMLARNEFFELLEDATTTPAKISRARAKWRQHTAHAQTIKGLFAHA